MISADTQARLRSVRADLVLTAAAFLLFVGALWTSFDWSFSAGLFPRLVAVTGIAVALLHLTVLVTRPAQRYAPESSPDEEQDEDAIEAVGPEYAFGKVGRRVWITNCGWVFAFLTGIYVFGLFLTAPLFTLAYLRFSSSASWRFSVLYAGVIAAVLFFVVDQLLHIPMPLGVIQE